ANDDGLALKALDRIERQITLQAKLLGEIDRPANLAGSEEWAALRAKIVEALAPFPAARAAVLEALDDAG
ncbi:MAG TPA: hypothetical protein VFL91_03175, partial [Thermomicrobiales bacterium]|nr:hypothetical protein [Thermomicrobiales bacterium]